MRNQKQAPKDDFDDSLDDEMSTIEDDGDGVSAIDFLE